MVPASGISSAYPGKYVAINTKTDEVVLVADTPQELYEDIQAKGPRTVATTRAEGTTTHLRRLTTWGGDVAR